MDKQLIINQIVTDMIDLPQESLDRLRISLIYHLRDYNLSEIETLPSVNSMSNDAIIERFIVDKSAQNLKVSTVKAYAQTIRGFLYDNGLHWSTVTADDITNFIAIRRYKEHISTSYMSCIRKRFSVFFGWLFTKKYLSDDIMLNVPAIKAHTKKKERLTDDEVEDCRSIVKTDIEKALFELMISTGLRVGEIRMLNIENIDFDRSEIEVFGEKNNQWRTVFMTPPCKHSLKSYIGIRNNGALFLSHGKRISRNRIEQIAKGISIRANCHVTATVHVYRKTFASVLYRKTGDSLLVSKLLGHSGVDVTVQYYLIDDIDDMKHKVLKVS